MTEKTDEIDVLIEETPKTDENPVVEVVKVDETPAKPIVEPEEGLKKLQEQLDAEKAARIQATADRDAAITRANQQAESANRAQTDVHETNIQLVTNAIESVKQSLTLAKSQYAEAMGAQDYAAAADAQEAIAEAKSRQLTLENGLQSLKSQPKPEVQRQFDPVEQMAAEVGKTAPRSAAWLRAHPEYVTNERLNRRMIAAANLAETDGLAIDSPEYFDAVERTLGIKEASLPGEEPLSAAAEPVERRAAPAAAPVTRSANGAGTRPNTVRLTAAEVEMAGLMGQTPQEYAAQKLRIAKEKVN